MQEELIKEIEQIESKHWWYIGRRKIIHSAIKKLIPTMPNPPKLLDIGCGTGENIKYFSQISTDITGMETNTIALELARNKLNTPLIEGSLPNNIPFENELFDMVFLLDVIEHIDEDILSLEKVKDKIKPNGYVVITVPAFMFLWSAHDYKNEHKRRYTLNELKAKTEQSGYKIITSNYFSSILFPIVSIVRLIKTKLDFMSDKSDLFLPTKPVNYVLTKLMELEGFLINTIKFPAGSSAMVIARKEQ